MGPHACHLGCSEESLSRATLALTALRAKAFLTQRIALEARRLLVHTLLPVAAISDQLGSDAATHFVKFLRLETALTAGALRTAQLAR